MGRVMHIDDIISVTDAFLYSFHEMITHLFIYLSNRCRLRPRFTAVATSIKGLGIKSLFYVLHKSRILWISLPYTFFLLNGDMELNRDR